MGGGNSSSSWGGGGGGNAAPIDTTSLISAREGKQAEVDQTLSVLRDIEKEYGVTMNDVEIGIFPKGSKVMGYYDPSSGALGMNASYFDAKKIDSAYDKSVQSKYHPPRGNKTGMEAVASHEAGHRLTYVAAEKSGKSPNAFSAKVIEDSATKLRYKNSANMAKKISGYATENYKEAIAEAFADVYCNGKNAKKESHTVVNTLKSYLK